MVTLKKLRIRSSSEKHKQATGLVKKIIALGPGLVIILSYFLSRISAFFYGIEQAGKYENVIEEFRSPENRSKEFKLGWWNKELNSDEIQLNKELNKDFFNCVKEANGEELSKKDSKNFCSLSLEDQFSEIDNYLQDRKINVHSLDIYLFRDGKGKSEQKRYWRLIKGRNLYVINLAKALLVNNLTRLVRFVQTFIPEKIKTQQFSFYLEVCIKILVFTLLIRVLRKRSPLDKKLSFQEGGALGGELLESLCNFAASFLPWSTSFISMLPPSNIQKISSFKWVILSVFVILLSTLLEEYTEKNAEEANKRKNIFLRKSFQFRFIVETVILVNSNLLINYYSRGSENYSKSSNSTTKRINEVLVLANKLISSVVEVMIYWKDKLSEEISEKAL